MMEEKKKTTTKAKKKQPTKKKRVSSAQKIERSTTNKRQQDIENIFATSPNRDTKIPKKTGKKRVSKAKKASVDIEVQEAEKALKETMVMEAINNPMEEDRIPQIPKHYLFYLGFILIIINFLFLLSHQLILNDINHTIKNTENRVEYRNINDNILFFGDSITKRYDLETYFGDHVINQGIDGETAADLLKRMKTSVYDYNTQKMFLLIGTNDLAYDEEITDIVEDIEKIIQKTQNHNPHTKIYIESVLPVAKRAFDGNRSNQTIKELNQKIKSLCDEMNVTYISLYDAFLDKDGYLKEEYTKDGLHLSEAGYRHLTTLLKKYVNEK